MPAVIAVEVADGRGDESPRHYQYPSAEITIGRVAGNDLVLPRTSVSRHHARLVLKGGKFILIDLDSTNGTFVNGRKLTAPVVVERWDVIYVGDFTVKLADVRDVERPPIDTVDSVDVLDAADDRTAGPPRSLDRTAGPPRSLERPDPGVFEGAPDRPGSTLHRTAGADGRADARFESLSRAGADPHGFDAVDERDEPTAAAGEPIQARLWTERALDVLDLIHHSPDSDDPKLVYADLLEERGDPRGGFIALQCECRQQADPRAAAPADSELREQNRPHLATLDELASRHGGDWFGPLIRLATPNASDALEVADRLRCVIVDNGSCAVRIGYAPEGQAAQFLLERGFLAHPLCLTQVQVNAERDRLQELSPTLYAVERQVYSHRLTTVYKARVVGPRGLGDHVAVKCSTLAHPLTGPASRGHPHGDAVLRYEMRIARLFTQPGRPRAPNIVDYRGPAYWGLFGDLALVMEWIDGADLRSLAARAHAAGRRVPVALAAGVASQLCLALHQVHTARDAEGRAARLVHADVRPDHVVVSNDGVVKLIDFGRAKADPVVMPVIDQQPGQPHGFSLADPSEPWRVSYAAGELLSSRVASPQGDLFAVGVMLYELLGGRHPFLGPSSTPDGVVAAICRSDFVPPESVPEIPPPLAPVIARAMAHLPDDRYPDAMAMRRDLESVIDAAGWSSSPHAMAEYLLMLPGL